jgi:hypothetical protein
MGGSGRASLCDGNICRLGAQVQTASKVSVPFPFKWPLRFRARPDDLPAACILLRGCGFVQRHRDPVNQSGPISWGLHLETLFHTRHFRLVSNGYTAHRHANLRSLIVAPARRKMSSLPMYTSYPAPTTSCSLSTTTCERPTRCRRR